MDAFTRAPKKMSWSPTYQSEALMIANLEQPTVSQKMRLITLRVLRKGKYIRALKPVDEYEEARLNQMFEVAKRDFLG